MPWNSQASNRDGEPVLSREVDVGVGDRKQETHRVS